MSPLPPSTQSPAHVPLRILAAFWLVAWLGTCVGGGLFGAFAGPPGIVIGFGIAAVVGGPIHLSGLLLTIVGPLVRLRYAMAVFAGSLTGVFSVTSAMGYERATAPVLAALIGGVATFFVIRRLLEKTSLKNYRAQLFPRDYQFSLRETFVFLTLVAVIAAVVATVLRSR